MYMRESSNTTILAIDGGGSRCRLACETADRRVRVETGPANAFSDFEGTITQITNGLSTLAEESGFSVDALVEVPTFIGLAGAISDDIIERLRASLPFQHVRIEDDRPAALRGALGTQDGAIIHCGTGSFLAFQQSGQMRLAGGWGSILGDEASARWLGWKALNVALRVADGTLPDNSWSRSFVTDFGGVDKIVMFAGGATPAEFGALAPRVTEAAHEGDPLANAIMSEGARYLSDSITALGWSDGMALCLTGGVAPLYRDHLPRTLQEAICAPIGEPLDGALALAREMSHDKT